MNLSKSTIGTRRWLIREWAYYLCIRYYTEVNNIGGKRCGLKACVKHINSTALQNESDVRINATQVYDIMKKMKLRGTPLAIISYPPINGFYNMPHYIYFQRMKTNGHSLQMTNSSKTKLRSHLPQRDMKFIDAEVRILPKQRMGYGKTNLHDTPHGSELISNKDSSDHKLKMHGIGHTMISHGGKHGIVNMVDGWGLFVMYDNHPLFADILDLDGKEDSLLHWVVDDAIGLVVDKTRTKATSGFFNNRIRFGFGQNQPPRHKHYRSYVFSSQRIKEGASRSIPTEGEYDPMTDAQAIPTMCTAVFDALPAKVKIFIANIAEMGQKSINLYHGKDALNDMLRNRLFSHELNKRLGFPHLKANFEYYDILITSSKGYLNRHMDVSVFSFDLASLIM